MADAQSEGSPLNVSRLGSERWKDALVIAASVAATILWVISSGKDLNFDQLNYHFYLPFNLLGDRLQQDFAGANGQSYLNPVAYLPFYWMVVNEWHSMLIASVLAFVHALNVVLAYFMTMSCLAGRDNARVISVLGACMAFASPIYLMEAGTTFADITTATLVLAAVLSILRAKVCAPWWKDGALLAGLCLGAACGLKLSNLVFAPAFAVLLLCLSGTFRTFLRSAVLLGSAAAAGLLITHGYWSWRLWEEFGNPFFPIFNSFFESSDFQQTGGLHERFLPDGALDAALLPFRMIALRSWIYIESVAPDLRFAALCCLLVVACGLALKRGLRDRGSIASQFVCRGRKAALLLFFLSAFVTWLWTSGNGRYGIVVSLICGPVLVLLLDSMVRSRTVAVALLTTLLGLQVVHLGHAQLRWSQEAWTSTWYDVSIPSRLQREPYLYISIGGNSNSYVFPFLAHGSAFTNPMGYVSFDLDGPGGKRLRELMARFEGRVRVMALQASAQGEDKTDSEKVWIRSADSMIARLGYEVDAGDCSVITTSGKSNETGLDYEATEARRLRTCVLKPRPFQMAAQRRRIAAVASRVEAWCPKLFRPAPGVIERTPIGWFANYPATDITLIIRDDGYILATQSRTSADIFLGTVSQWEAGQRPDCDAMPSKPRDVYTFD